MVLCSKKNKKILELSSLRSQQGGWDGAPWENYKLQNTNYKQRRVLRTSFKRLWRKEGSWEAVSASVVTGKTFLSFSRFHRLLRYLLNGIRSRRLRWHCAGNAFPRILPPRFFLFLTTPI
jgi:hypothetical protein